MKHSAELEQVFSIMAGYASQHNHRYVTLEHLLRAVLDSATMYEIVDLFDIDRNKLVKATETQLKSIETLRDNQQPVPTNSLLQLYDGWDTFLQEKNRKTLEVADVIYMLLCAEETWAQYLLLSSGLEKRTLLEYIDAIDDIDECTKSKKKKKNKSMFDSGMKIPKSAQDTIPFYEVYENGIFLVGEDRYTLIFSFDNLDYSLLRESEQIDIYNGYQKLLNALPTDITYQEFIMNSAINSEQLRKSIMPKDRRYGRLYDDYCDVLEESVEKSVQACAKKVMLVALSYKPLTKVDNVNVLFKYYRELQTYFDNLKVEIHQLMPEEVFKIIYEYYHPFDETEFLLPKNYFQRGNRLKDYIAPSMFAFKGKEVLIVKGE